MDTFAKERPKLLGTTRKFARHGKSGTWVSECLPHLAKVVDDIAVRRSRWRPNVFNHGPAKVFVNTGSPQFGRPSMGSWVTYGLGSESQDLPGFVVLQSGPRGPRGGAALLGQRLPADDLPGRAVPLRRRADPQPVAARRASSRDRQQRRASTRSAT